MSICALFTTSLDRAIAASPAGLLQPLQGAQLLITGATGFFGGWVLRAIGQLQSQGFAIQADCLSRNPKQFLDRNPDVAAIRGLLWRSADATNFASAVCDLVPTHILHMAASSDARDYAVDPLAAAQTILDGTGACIEIARKTGAHLHFVSSGAVYGARRASHGPCRESEIQHHAPDPLDRTKIYGNAKRMAESLVATGLEDFSISRPFAFLGPLLPLDQHFAAGNFVADAAAGRAIQIKGDGAPLRSYLHPADLAVWLLALMASGPRGEALNIGSDEPVSISDLARTISEMAGTPPPVIALPPSGGDPPAYWPDVSRAREYGLTVSSRLCAAIEDTLQWARLLRA